MRILVTGAGGFVGQHLVPVLAKRGHEVVATDTELSGLHRVPADEHVVGDISDDLLRRQAIRGCEAVIHLATVPGGAAELAPAAARRINVEAAMALSEDFARAAPGAPFVFASSIAVFGNPLPEAVDDDTPLAPRMVYGAHKAMLETWLEALFRRGALAPLSVRLPGIVARPIGSSGMKSAFLSDLFHALVQKRPFTVPMSPNATLWLMSVEHAALCLAHAVDVATTSTALTRSLTLPALWVRLFELVAEVASQAGADLAMVEYEPDDELEQGFGRQPPLSAARAEALGFGADADLESLVNSALATLQL